MPGTQGWEWCLSSPAGLKKLIIIHILWCIKLLEEVSQKRFYAKSSQDFDFDPSEDPDLEDRKSLIVISSKLSINVYKNYYYWDTHQKYFLPPAGAQEKIIKKWKS